MLSTSLSPLRTSPALRTDLLLFRITHRARSRRASPSARARFHAGGGDRAVRRDVLRVRALAVLVPIAGMMLGDAMLGFYDLRMMAAVYGTLALPACAACLSDRLRRPLLIVPMLLSSSLIFFLVTNFAVWAFSPLYAANAAGLVKCYVAGLPFLRNMAEDDLFWGLVLFGGYWLLQNIRAAKREDRRTVLPFAPDPRCPRA